jgi:hypothetical protein
VPGAHRSRSHGAAWYSPGDVLLYSRSSQETGIAKGEYARVVNVDAPANRLTVEWKDGTERSYDPRRQQGVSVYREQERAFSTGDRVQLTAPSAELELASRELGTVEGISEGRMALRMDDGRSVNVDLAKHPHLDHGYAAPSHSSQGERADGVLIHVDTPSSGLRTCSTIAWTASPSRAEPALYE